MGDLKTVFGDYMKAFAKTAKIKAAPAEFAQQTTEILAALAKRIERENNELYPLLDAS